LGTGAVADALWAAGKISELSIGAIADAIAFTLAAPLLLTLFWSTHSVMRGGVREGEA